MQRWQVRRSCVHPSECPSFFDGTPDRVEDAMQELAIKTGHGGLDFKYFRRNGAWEIHGFFMKKNRTRGVYMKIQEVLNAPAS